MITYLTQNSKTPQELSLSNPEVLNQAIWIDLICTSHKERALFNSLIPIEIPTKEEMDSIELSSRLYRMNDRLYMTTMTLANSKSEEPKLEPITYILTPNQLITIRDIYPKSFDLLANKIKLLDDETLHPITVFIELIDVSIDRLADILEFVGNQLDEYSKIIFHYPNKQKLNYQHLFRKIGAAGDLDTKARESIITFNRLITFFQQTKNASLEPENQARLTTFTKDIAALSEHSTFLSTKINFLLDATLGMVNIEQNNIIKLFSVAAVIFLPPTLIASIYGMNFSAMPELSWKYGYVLALALMSFAAWLPYKYFKFKKWL